MARHPTPLDARPRLPSWLARPRQAVRRAGLALAIALVAGVAHAQTYEATPDNLAEVVPLVGAGDTLILAEGDYASGIDLSGKHGTADSPITVTGPEDRSRVARIHGRAVQEATAEFPGTGANVLLGDCSYIVIRNLTLDGWDGRTLAATVAPMYLRGLSTVYSADTPCHHVTIENLTVMNYGGNQSTSGISTKTPAWDWKIRRNLVIGAGTGMYLGNSDGTMPFVGGLVEDNIVVNTVGYNIQVKHQLLGTRDVAGMPAEATTTIRNNVFSNIGAPYNYAGINAGARPNLLLDPFPPSGNGSNDMYLVYGNFLYQNYESDALFQGTGNLALYNNLFVNSIGTKQAVNIQAHNGSNRKVRVFFNTVLATNRGIKVADIESGYEGQQLVFGNAVFSATPLSLAAGVQSFDNVTAAYASAASHLVNPTGVLGQLDLFPLAGALTGSATDTSSVESLAHWNADFNGAARDATFRGAYSGEGTNPGWLPVRDHKPTAGGLGLPVMPANRAPTIQSGPTANPSTATPGQEIAFSVEAADPDGDVLTVLWHFGDGVLGSGASTHHGYWQDATTPVSSGTYTVKVLVRDSWGASCSATLQVQIGLGGDPVLLSGGVPDLVLGEAKTGGNREPVISSYFPETPHTMWAGSSQVFEVWAHDDDDDALNYLWKLDGEPVGTNASTYSYGPAIVGSHTIEASVSDGQGGVATHTWDVTVLSTDVTLLAPVGKVSQRRPEFSWGAVAGAEKYELWVRDCTSGTNPVLHEEALTGPTYTPGVDLVWDHTYEWWVRAYAGGSWAPWRSYTFFVVVSPDPVLLAPRGAKTEKRPEFSWEAVTGADRYEIWVRDCTSGTNPVINDSTITGTSYTPAADLTLGHTYEWWVRARVGGTWAPWRSYTFFVIVPGNPVLVSPRGPVSQKRPEFSWEAVAGAEKYEIWVRDCTSGTNPVLNVNTITGTTYTPGVDLTLGHVYEWWVRAYAGGAWAPWRSYTFCVIVPGDPVLLAPQGKVSQLRPEFSWEAVAEATKYEIWVRDCTDGTNPVLNVNTITGTAYTPGVDLTAGHTYEWWVRAYGGAWAPWRSYKYFSVQE